MMRLPSTTTVLSVCTEDVAGLMTVTWAITSGAAGVFCALMDAINAHSTAQPRREAKSRNRMLKRVHETDDNGPSLLIRIAGDDRTGLRATLSHRDAHRHLGPGQSQSLHFTFAK